MTAHRKIRFLCLVVVFVFLYCSEDSNPFTPDYLINTDLAFFPLEEGYKAEYKYYYSYYWTTSSEFDFSEGTDRIDAKFDLEVVDFNINEARKEAFYKIRTSFTPILTYHYSNPEDTVWDNVTDSLITSEYDLMLKNGFLWYVENAPSFDRLNEGDTTMMMAPPIGGGGEMNLKLFPLPSMHNLPFSTRFYGDTCSYDSGIFALGGSVNAATVKNVGVLNVFFRYAITSLHFSQSRIVRYDLIE